MLTGKKLVDTLTAELGEIGMGNRCHVLLTGVFGA